MIQTETVPYKCGERQLKGYLAFNKSAKEQLPAVIIAPDYRGLGDLAKDKAESLAKYGYLAFAADVYGEGEVADSDQKATELMAPLFLNRKLLRERIGAAYNQVKKNPLCNKSKIAAIGFCFGGLNVIELLRSGANLRGIVSFHGVYGDSLGPLKAQCEPNAPKLHGAALLMHGYEDPLLPPDDVAKLQNELNESGIDWQMHIFGHTSHGFTNPLANAPDRGIVFNPLSSRRAWQMMHLFLEEIFARNI